MKISFLSVFPPYRGGISKHSSLIYSHLSKKHDVQAINFNKLYPALFFPGKSQYDTKLDLIGDRLINSVNFFSWNKPIKSIQKYNPDTLLFKFWHPFFSPAYNFIIKKVKKKTNCDVIMICDNIFPHEKFPFSKRLIKKLVKNVDGFIVQSSIVEKELNSLIDEPIYNKVFHPIYNNYPDLIDKSLAKRALNIHESKVVLFFGFVRDYKGLDILIKSMRKVFEKESDIKLLIAGECYDEKDKYDKLINESDYKNKIIWVEDFISDDDINIYFSAADVVVLPYRSASQSGVIPLSYHYNRPVITSNLESLIEVVEDKKTGIIFDLKKEDSLESAILDFFKNYKLVSYYENIDNYKRNFSWENFISAIEDISERLNERK